MKAKQSKRTKTKRFEAERENLKRLTQKLGIDFQNEDLLLAALTHRSRAMAHNERLEFLGDAILNFSIAAELYTRFPKAKEGELTRLRAKLVRGETLAEVARDLELGNFLRLGEGELKSGGFKRDSILANALEAIIAALYLDSGMESVRKSISEWFHSRLSSIEIESSSIKDAKTRLQEFLQSKHLPLPEYEVSQVEGDSHNPLFTVNCLVSLKKEPVLGRGNTRRKAEQAAAEAMLKVLLQHG
jgi:ribonuclease III